MSERINKFETRKPAVARLLFLWRPSSVVPCFFYLQQKPNTASESNRSLMSRRSSDLLNCGFCCPPNKRVVMYQRAPLHNEDTPALSYLRQARTTTVGASKVRRDASEGRCVTKATRQALQITSSK